MKLVLALVASLATAGTAAAAVLDFSGNICDTGACSNNSRILDSYGDIPGMVDVVYDFGIVSSATDRRLFWWNTYSELQAVAWGGSSDTVGRPTIFFDPEPGYTVTVTGFRLGSYLNTNRTTQVSVLDGLGNTLFASPANTPIGALSTLFSGPWSSPSGILIAWGPNGYNVGIDDIEYNVRPTSLSPVPLPAPAALLGAGLALMAGLRRFGRRA